MLQFTAPKWLVANVIQRMLSWLSYVVVPADIVVQDPLAWAPLDATLLVENTRATATFGQTAGALSELLRALPSASVCVDIDTAMSVDRSWQVLNELLQLDVCLARAGTPNALQYVPIAAARSSAWTILDTTRWPSDTWDKERR